MPLFCSRDVLAIHAVPESGPLVKHFGFFTRRKLVVGRGKYRGGALPTVHREMVHIVWALPSTPVAGVEGSHIDIGGIGRARVERERPTTSDKRKRRSTRGSSKTNAGFDYSRSRQTFPAGGTLLKVQPDANRRHKGQARCSKTSDCGNRE